MMLAASQPALPPPTMVNFSIRSAIFEYFPMARG
jgi:hypothetical protein